MFISLKESRIENNKSFYGCFYLGSFDSGQSLTVANALRRSLLSDCTGLAIISVKIDNVQHEYSTLPGVRDSVLDILLNFKEMSFKKIPNPLGGPNGYKNKGFSSIYNKLGSTFFKPVIGYLKVKGPGTIRAKDLRLPPFVQCVDPNQYLATLADDGFLNVKFVIMEGKGYYIQKLTSEARQGFEDSLTSNSLMSNKLHKKYKSSPTTTGKKSRANFRLSPSEDSNNLASQAVNVPAQQLRDPSNYWTIIKKRQNYLRQLKQIMSQQSNNTLASKTPNLSVPSSFFTDTGEKDSVATVSKRNEEFMGPFLEKTTNTEPLNSNSKQLNIDAVFNPVTKVNYVIEPYDNYIVQSFNEKFKLIENLTSFLDSADFLETNFPYFHRKAGTTVVNAATTAKTYHLNEDENQQPSYKKNLSENLLDYLTNLSPSDLENLYTPEGYSHYKGIQIPSSFTESIIPTTLNKDSFEQLFQSGLNVNSKEVVLLEIYTDGSVHPRDALLMAFRNLSYTFSPEKIKMNNPIFSDSASYKKIIESF